MLILVLSTDEGLYWVYPTSSYAYEDQTYMDAFSSPDLINWTKHPRILTTADVTWAKEALWAPAPIFRNGKYFLYFAANDIQEGEPEAGVIGGIGVAVSDKPQGPYVDAIGEPLIGDYHNGAQPIDQDVFIDDVVDQRLTARGRGDGFAMMDTNFTDLVFEATVEFAGNGENVSGYAGLMFHALNVSEGPDVMSGWQAGLRLGNGTLPGLVQLSTVAGEGVSQYMDVLEGKEYHLRVTSEGTEISVFVDDMETPKASFSDSFGYDIGTTGVWVSGQSVAKFGSVSVSRP
ncbi:glycosyl hydrolase [Xylariaceae sp. FL0016]|nr:glycosyl hydrolase [Xylariaceae sp. FL0016]